jgi:hypothetical protein
VVYCAQEEIGDSYDMVMISMVNIKAIKSIDNRNNNDAIKLMDKKGGGYLGSRSIVAVGMMLSLQLPGWPAVRIESIG